MTSSSDVIDLRNGPTVPAAVVRLAVDLEDRGFHLRIEGAKLVVRSATVALCLTKKDKILIKQWRHHLLAVVSYCEDHK